MVPPGEEGLFLDLRPDGTAEGVRKRFPPPYFLAFMDGARARDKAGLMAEIAAALKFPAHFGRNWDALLDCLRSLPDEVPAGGYALAVLNSGDFLSASGKDREDFAEIAGDARAFLREKFRTEFTVVLL